MGKWDDETMRRTPKVSKPQSPKVKTIGLNGLSIQPYMIERSQMRHNHMRAAI